MAGYCWNMMVVRFSLYLLAYLLLIFYSSLRFFASFRSLLDHLALLASCSFFLTTRPRTAEISSHFHRVPDSRRRVSLGRNHRTESTPSSTSSTVFGCARVYSLHVLELWVSSSRPSTNYFLTPHRSVSDRLLSLILPDARTTLVARYILDKPKPNLPSCRWNPA